MLRSAIVHHTVQLSPNAMQHFTVGKVSKIVDQQVRVALETTWDAAFSLEAAVCRICGAVALALFLFWDPSISVGWRISTFASFLPFTMIAFNVVLLGRSIGRLSQLSQESIDAVAAWSEYMMEAMSLRPLIMSYKLGYATADSLKGCGSTFRASRYQADTVFTAELFSLIPRLLHSVRGLRMQRHEEMRSLFISPQHDPGVRRDARTDFQLLVDGRRYASIREVAELLNSDTRRRLLLLSSASVGGHPEIRHAVPGRNRDNIHARARVSVQRPEVRGVSTGAHARTRARATRLSATCSIPTLPSRRAAEPRNRAISNRRASATARLGNRRCCACARGSSSQRQASSSRRVGACDSLTASAAVQRTLMANLASATSTSTRTMRSGSSALRSSLERVDYGRRPVGVRREARPERRICVSITRFLLCGSAAPERTR